MLYQPLEEEFKPTPNKENAISLKRFLELLENEEDYFKGEQHCTRIMITRLRKIFYDIYGWNSQLIRGAADIQGRYEVKLVPGRPSHEKGDAKEFMPKPKHRVVTVKEGDWMNPDAGTIPEIFANNNQQVVLPSGLYCDMGHVLGGMDAFNYRAPVTPLPNVFLWLKRLFPLVDSNMDIVTWLGDIASSAGEFLYKELQEKRDLTDEEMQKIINRYAPGPDMLGDIDPYVICQIYNTKAEYGLRVTEIFRDYYSESGLGAYYRKRRSSYFSSKVGLIGWDGNAFQNEGKWMEYYMKQLKNNNAFYIFSRCEGVRGVFLALFTWMGHYKHTTHDRLLLRIFLNSVKRDIKTETKTD